MKIRQAVLALLIVALLGACSGFWANGADAAVKTKRQKKAYEKGILLPPGWKYEVGYALWRAEKGLAATPQTWRKYKREKRWRAMRGKKDNFVLSSLDWTTEELAAFLQDHGELFQFQPSGVEPERE